MYRVVLGKISAIHEDTLPAPLRMLAPEGGRRAPWIAGRALLLRAFNLTTLPEIVFGVNGKPAFRGDIPLWFNISHSGDDIAVLVSNQGDVGCDLEILRPRQNWHRIAEAMFSSREQAELMSAAEENQLHIFWQIWTRKEALLKYAGQSVWSMADHDSFQQNAPFTHQFLIDNTSVLALCTSTPYAFPASDLHFYNGEKAVRVASIHRF